MDAWKDRWRDGQIDELMDNSVQCDVAVESSFIPA